MAGIAGISQSTSGFLGDMALMYKSCLYSLYPIRLLRMIFDYGVESSEESLVRFFEAYGPVVAIGKPGETLVTPGSERLYVSDDEWQGRVKSEMVKSQAIIIQPGTSVGIQWELEQVRELVNPYSVLLCLVNFWRKPEPYEALRIFAKEHLAVEMPRVVPYLDRPAFVYFNREWVPRLQELSYRSPMLWPLIFDAADLRYSLQPFVEGMFGGDQEPPRPPRWSRGLDKLAANIGALILAGILIFVPLFVVRYITQPFVYPLTLGTDNLVPKDLQIPNLVRRSQKVTLNGKSVAYKIDVPEALIKVTSSSEMLEHWRKSPDGRLSLQVLAHASPEDMSLIAQQRLKANSGKDILEGKLESVRTIEQAGTDWTEVRIGVTSRNGIKAKEISWATSDSTHGSVLLIAGLLEFPESDPIYSPIVEDMFRSFRFIGKQEVGRP